MTTRGSRRDDYVRLSLMTVGDLGLVGGLISWILGWRFGHLLVTLSLILLIAGLWPGRFRLRKSVAGGHLLVGRDLKGEEALGQARTAAHHYRKLAAKHPDEGLLLLATTLDWQRSLLQNLGKHAEAVPVAREAVESWREVVTTDPTRREDLSKALNRLTVSLSFPVHQEEAISLTAEAIDVQRSLVAAQEELLAQHLSNLANALHNTGQWEAELPVVEEAATLYRRLVPGNRELLPQAADNAEELGTTLRELDRLHEAVDAAREWVGYERTLAARQPDREPQLAEAVRMLGSRLVEIRQYDEGSALWHESLDLRRQLAAASPEHRPAYAEASATIGVGLGAVGRIAESLAAFRAGLEVRRSLAAVDSRQYDDLVDELAQATVTLRLNDGTDGVADAADVDGAARAFAAEAVRVAREHADVVTLPTRRSAAEWLRRAGFSAEADELSGERG